MWYYTALVYITQHPPHTLSIGQLTALANREIKTILLTLSLTAYGPNTYSTVVTTPLMINMVSET